MKNFSKKILQITAASLFAFLLAGCSDLIKPNSSSLTVSFSKNNGRSAIISPEGSDVDHYSVELKKDGKLLTIVKALPDSTTTFQELDPGTYSIIVEGWKTEEEVEASHAFTTDKEKSDKSVTLAAGDNKTYSIFLKSYAPADPDTPELRQITAALKDGVTKTFGYTKDDFTVTAAYSSGESAVLSADEFSIEYDSTAFGLVPVTVTENLSGSEKSCTCYAPVKLSLSCGTLTLNSDITTTVTEYETATFSVSGLNSNLTKYYTFYSAAGEKPASVVPAAISYEWVDVTDSSDTKSVSSEASFTSTDYVTAGTYTFQCNATITAANDYVILEGSAAQNLQVQLTVTAAPTVYTSSKVSDFISAVEAVKDTSTPSVFAVCGTLSLTQKITVSGNVKIIVSTAGATFTRSSAVAMFAVEPGATLTLAGDYPLTLGGQNKSTSTALIENSGNLIMNEQVTISNADCSNSYGAAAILVSATEGNASLKITGGEISGCSSKGAIVYCYASDPYAAEVDISGLTISGNTSGDLGTFCFEDNVYGSIKNTTFEANSSDSGNGGAMNIAINTANSLLIEGCTFNENSVSNDNEGGALYINSGKVTIKNTVFTDNISGSGEEELANDIYYNNAEATADRQLTAALHLDESIEAISLRINKCNDSSSKIYLGDSFTAPEAIYTVLTNTGAADFVSGTQLFAAESSSTKTLTDLITGNLTTAGTDYSIDASTGCMITK